MDEIWGQACAALETSVGPNNFNHWIKPLRLTGVDAGIAHFASPTRFISDWVNRHFAKDILGELSRHGAPVERLRFEVVPQQAPGRARPAAAARGGDAAAAAAGLSAVDAHRLRLALLAWPAAGLALGLLLTLALLLLASWAHGT